MPKDFWVATAAAVAALIIWSLLSMLWRPTEEIKERLDRVAGRLFFGACGAFIIAIPLTALTIFHEGGSGVPAHDSWRVAFGYGAAVSFGLFLLMIVLAGLAALPGMVDGAVFLVRRAYRRRQEHLWIERVRRRVRRQD
jgi:Flp pilus assembly protein TadB